MTGEDALALAKNFTRETALGQGAIQIPGPPGSSGREVQIQNNGSYIQWRYVGDPSWINIVALSDLKGNPGNDGADGQDGQDGTDGETPQFRMSGNTLQYKFPSQNTWTDLFTFPAGSGGGYEPPQGGIPREDLAQDVQDSLDKADTALQTESDPVYRAEKPTLALKTELAQKMPVAPQDGEIHGASGDTWYVLDDMAKRAVIMISEALSVTETGNVITIEQSDFDRLDEFTVDYNGARVVFSKGSPVNELYGVGENRAYYKFEFDQSNRTITVTDMGRLADASSIPAPPETGTVILQSVDGVIEWVKVPTLLAVDKE